VLKTEGLTKKNLEKDLENKTKALKFAPRLRNQTALKSEGQKAKTE